MNQMDARTSPFARSENPNIFVGGITSDMTTQDVLKYLSNFDKVDSLEMPRDPSTNEWKGYAKARLHSQQGLERLLRQPSHWVKSTQLGIKPWFNKTDYLANKDEINKRKLFVKFQPLMTADQLRSYFQRFGPVEAVELKHDSATKKPRYFGFVIFQHATDAYQASLHGACQTKNQKIWCELTTPKFMIDKRTKGVVKDQWEHQKDRQQFLPKTSESVNALHASRPEFAQQIISSGSLNEVHVGLSRKRKQGHVNMPSLELDKTKGLKSKALPQLASFSVHEAQLPTESYLHNLRNTQTEIQYKATPFGDRSNVNSPPRKQDHHLKPTSKKYPQTARISVAENHCYAYNLSFRLIQPSIR